METKKYRSRIKAWAIFFWCIDTSIADTLTPNYSEGSSEIIKPDEYTPMGVLFPSGFIFLGYYYTLDIEWFWMFHERKSRPLFHHICYWKSKDFISWWMIETFFRGWKHVYNMDGKRMHKEVAEFIFSGFSTPKLKSRLSHIALALHYLCIK